jgi:hypothetical protein
MIEAAWGSFASDKLVRPPNQKTITAEKRKWPFDQIIKTQDSEKLNF